MPDDIRTLAQAVVDAHAAWVDEHNDPQRKRVEDAYDALTKALGPIYDGDTAKRILAALDAAEAQGYARAMGEVVAHAEVTALGHRVAIQCGMLTNGRVQGGRTLRDGANSALVALADWGRERLPAEAERD